MNRFSRPVFGVFAATVGALVAVVVFFYLTAWAQEAKPDIKVETTPVNRDARLGVSFAPVIKQTAPCVVYIYSTRIVHVRPYRNPLLNDPFFRQFFGDQIPQSRTTATTTNAIAQTSHDLRRPFRTLTSFHGGVGPLVGALSSV